MRDIPIIYSHSMVRALLEDRKTQMRRLLYSAGAAIAGIQKLSGWQKTAPGDRMWVRENWFVSKRFDHCKPSEIPPRQMTMMYGAGGSMGGVLPMVRKEERSARAYIPDMTYPEERPEWAGKMRIGRFMPRWASRLTLVVTAVKIERIRSITEEDSRLEGMGMPYVGDYFGTGFEPDRINYTSKHQFRLLWQSLYGEESWRTDPKVVALSFTVHKCNIDALPENIAA